MRHPFLRTLAGASVTDPNFENVILLLHGDGTNGAQNSTFLDSSTNNITVLAAGEVSQGTFSPFGNNWSNFFDGTGDYLTTPDNAAFDFGTGDFTIEAWVYINANSTPDAGTLRPAGIFCGFPASGTLTNAYGFIINGNATTTGTGLAFQLWQSSTNYIVSATTTVSQNAWHHVAVARSGTTTKLFLDGAEVGSGTLGNQNVNTAHTLSIGRVGYAGYPNELNGYISNLRVLKGTALYTGSYTVPTVPLTAITNTSLLACQSNRIFDASANNFTLTRAGNVTVQRFSPFSPTAAYSASTIGGSGFFDLNLSAYFEFAAGLAPLSMGSSDFTFETWVYLRTAADSSIFCRISGAGASGESSYRLLTGATVSEVYSGSSFYSVTSPNPGVGQWAHVAWARTGGTFSSYLNGVRVGTIGTLGTSSLNDLPLVSLEIGNDRVNGFQIDGYLSGARIIKGSGGYNATSSTITVPTAPPTAVTNTSLLLNFTNAGVFDNAAMNNIVTNGNAQINTTIKKYGTGSIRFDGVGDNLTVLPTTDQILRAGPFTIELWVYLSATGVLYGLIAKGSANWQISVNTANNVVFTYGASTITSTGTLAATTWYHLAVVREGIGTNQTKIYINGTNDGTGTVVNDFTQVSDLFIGCLRTGGGVLNGYLDDIRITKGVARYTANFTPPTAAFPDL